MKKNSIGMDDEREFRQLLREENRLLKQELAEQRYALQRLQIEVKTLSASLALVTEKTNSMQQAQSMRLADMQLMMYTMADKYMPGNEDFLSKTGH